MKPKTLSLDEITKHKSNYVHVISIRLTKKEKLFIKNNNINLRLLVSKTLSNLGFKECISE